MKFLMIEGDVLVNLGLVERCEMRHHNGTAILWAGGLVLCESGVAYKYFKANAKNEELIIQ